MVRTEEEKVARTPIVVILGGKEYEIAPLVIRYSGEWRKKAVPLMGYLMSYTKRTDDVLPEETIIELFTTKMDEIIEGFFGYARELDREEIEGIATDTEILFAFLEVFNAFVAPLSVALPKNPTTKKRSQ